MATVNVSDTEFSEFIRNVEEMGHRIKVLEGMLLHLYRNTYERDDFLDLLHDASHAGHEYNENFVCEADAQFFYNLNHMAVDPEWKWQKIPSMVQEPSKPRNQQSLRERQGQ